MHLVYILCSLRDYTTHLCSKDDLKALKIVLNNVNNHPNLYLRNLSKVDVFFLPFLHCRNNPSLTAAED